MSGERTFRVSYEDPKTGERKDGITHDLSLGGMFVVTSSPLAKGALVTIEIDLEGMMVSVDARVLEREDDGMGVRFLDLPEDVATTLRMAVTTTTSQRTILGVGGATVKTTTPGIAVPEQAKAPPGPKIVPSIETTTPGIAAAKPEPKREPEPAPKEERKRQSSAPPPPPPKGGSAGRWLLLLLLGGGAAAAYVYREPLRRAIDDAIAPEPAPTVVEVVPVPLAEAGVAAADASLDATVDAAGADGAVDASADATALADAAPEAGARDAGARDAGRRDAGAL